jgi:hypothetical protein
MEKTEFDLQRAAADLVSREVYYCISSLVYALAGGAGSLENAPRLRGRHNEGAAALSELCEQASELFAPLPDYEEAAFQEGWAAKPDKACGYVNAKAGVESEASTWQELCEDERLDPYERKVFEHWIVSSWLADELEERGEKVDRDFAGMIVWARTTTGQGIASDYVIEQIADAMRR